MSGARAGPGARPIVLGVNGIRLCANRSGVARAIEALLHQFVRQSHPFDEIHLFSPAPVEPGVRLPADVRSMVVKSALPPGLWEQIALPRAQGGRGVLFCPSYVGPLFPGCPMLVAHHGSYEGYAGSADVFSRWSRMKKRVAYHVSAHRADVVTTVSEYSRRDMAHFYRLPAERIHVVPEGVDTTVFRPIHDAERLSAFRRQHFGDDVPFLLYVGKPTRRRNLPNLLAAFAELRRSRQVPHKLLLVGTALPGTSFEPLVAELGLGPHVVSIPHAEHEEVALAYNASSVTVYPSSYEGFGMPVLEAMACGAPVIALDNTAFPEFAGGVALLLPDAEVRTLADGIGRVLDDDQQRAAMREAGPVRAATYDWTHVARQYLDLLSPLAAGARVHA